MGSSACSGIHDGFAREVPDVYSCILTVVTEPYSRITGFVRRAPAVATVLTTDC